MIFIQPFLELSGKSLLKKISKNHLGWWFAGYFLVAAGSVFYTDDYSNYLVHLKLLLPMLMLPIGLLAPSFYRWKFQRLILWALIVVVFSAGLVSSVHYLMNFEAINEQIAKAKAVPVITGINHIYFSILLAFSIIVGFYFIFLWREKKRALWITMMILTVLNLLFLHLLAARTGLVGFYISMFVLIGVYVRKNRKYISAFLGLMGLALLGMWAVSSIPSLNQRYNNTLKDIRIYVNEGNPNYQSISTRLIAWQVSWQVFKTNPLIGVSPGDLGDHIQAQYKSMDTELIQENWIGPHNQYMQNLAGLGMVGLFVLLGLLLFPIRYYLVRGDWLGLGLFGLLAFSMMVESILERQTGIIFFTFFWFFCYRRSHVNEQIVNSNFK